MPVAGEDVTKEYTRNKTKGIWSIVWKKLASNHMNIKHNKEQVHLDFGSQLPC